jgi:Transcriptional regulators
MQDIADRAGVAISTVSYSLNNHPKIPEATRLKIQALARKMGYRPDAYVSTLMARLHGRRRQSEQAVLGLLTEKYMLKLFKTVPYHRDWYRGMQRRADELGYKIDIFQWEPETLPARNLATSLRARAIRGLVIAPQLNPSGSLDFPFETFSCVAVGGSLVRPELHQVNTHYSHAMELAVEKLVARGYRRPGLVLPIPFNSHIRSAYLSTFLAIQYLNRNLGKVPPCLTPDFSGFHDTVRPWFERHRPDVLLVVTPREVREIVGKSARVPEEVGMIDLTCDDRAEFSGIDQAGEALGRAAVENVVVQIHRGEVGIPAAMQTILLRGEWHEGTTLPPRDSAE